MRYLYLYNLFTSNFLSAMPATQSRLIFVIHTSSTLGSRVHLEL